MGQNIKTSFKYNLQNYKPTALLFKSPLRPPRSRRIKDISLLCIPYYYKYNSLGRHDPKYRKQKAGAHTGGGDRVAGEEGAAKEGCTEGDVEGAC